MDRREFIKTFVLNYMSTWCANADQSIGYSQFKNDIDVQTQLAYEMACQCWDKLLNTNF